MGWLFLLKWVQPPSPASTYISTVSQCNPGEPVTECCLLSFSHEGFPLGSTVRSETKGIWMWCVPHPLKPNHTLVLLDTEGLGDVEKVRQRVIKKSLFLSLCLPFNSQLHSNFCAAFLLTTYLIIGNETNLANEA